MMEKIPSGDGHREGECLRLGLSNTGVLLWNELGKGTKGIRKKVVEMTMQFKQIGEKVMSGEDGEEGGLEILGKFCCGGGRKERK